MRYKQVNQTGGVTTTKYYIDKEYELIKTTSKTERKSYIDDIGVHTESILSSGNTSKKMRYFHKDRLGSTTAITDEAGNVLEHHSFDAFGKPRDGRLIDKNPAKLASNETDRGFTDHEHLDDSQLIHMNGRAYDYNLGRFLSVDPFIQEPGNSQSMNPYSYIMNNPLAGTDPSGYKAEKADGSMCKRGSGVATGCMNILVTDLSSSAIDNGSEGQTSVNVSNQTTEKTEIGSQEQVNQKDAEANQGCPDCVSNQASISTTGGTETEESVTPTETAMNEHSGKKDVVLNEVAEKKVIEMRESMSDASSPTEEWFSVKEDGSTTSISIEGCTRDACSVTVNGSDLALAHLHVEQGNELETLGRELPGPQDHQVVEQAGVPNVIYTPKGRIMVVERINGQIKVRTIYGGSSQLNSKVERTYNELISKHGDNLSSAHIASSVRNKLKKFH